jgi:hypothetical protein
MTHPWLEDPDKTGALDRQTGVIAMGDGTMMHVPAPGSLIDQLGLDHVPLTTARSSGSAATRDQQAYGSYGAAPEGPKELTRVRTAR